MKQKIEMPDIIYGDNLKNWMQQVTNAINGEDCKDHYQPCYCRANKQVNESRHGQDMDTTREEKCHHRIIGEPSTMYGGKCRVCGYQVGDKMVSLEAVKELVRDTKHLGNCKVNKCEHTYNQALDDLLKKLEEL